MPSNTTNLSDTEIAPVNWETLASESCDGDFARLIPFDGNARWAFQHVVRELRHNGPDYLPHIRRMIHYEIISDEDYYKTDSSFSSEIDAAGSPTQYSFDQLKLEPQYCGYYRLSLRPERKPNNIRHGWVLGGRCRKRNTDSAIDILLTPTTYTSDIEGPHCLIHRDLTTGSTFLMARQHKVLINGSEWLQGPHTHTSQIVLQNAMSIQIDGFIYKFHYTNFAFRQDRKLRDDLNRELGRNPPKVPLQTWFDGSLVNKMKNMVDLHGYLIEPATRGGASCTVAFAQDRKTGAQYVIKTQMRDKYSKRRIKREIDTLRLCAHKNIVGLVAVIDPPDFTPLVYMNNEATAVHMVLAPAAPATVADMKLNWESYLDSEDEHEPFLIELISQVAQGLRFMHSKGIIHRDIKPENLGVVTIKPLHVIILDLGSTLHKTESKEAKVGTASYLAPEMWAIREENSNLAFGPKVDIFALGAAVYGVLTAGKDIVPIGHPKFRQRLKDIVDAEEPEPECENRQLVWAVMRLLLMPNPQYRFSATKVVQTCTEVLDDLRIGAEAEASEELCEVEVKPQQKKKKKTAG